MLDKTLEQRGNTYGNFHTHANLTQTLNAIINQHYISVQEAAGNKPEPLPNFMAESIHMICHKLARIANGNPYYADSWHDIAGYSQLVVEILEESVKAQKEAVQQD